MQSDHSATVEIGASLTHKCAEVAAKFARTNSITVTCQTVHEQLPRAVATQLASIATELVASAFNAFERGRGGRIQVYFDSTANRLDLTVEHSRPLPRAAGPHGVAHSWLTRLSSPGWAASSSTRS